MYTSQSRFEPQENSGGVVERAKCYAGEAVERADAAVRRNPASSMLITFAVGCGLGTLAVLMLAPRPAPRRINHPWLRSMSRSRLAQMIEELVPSSVARYVGGKS